MFTLTALLLIHFPSPVFEGQWFHIIIMCVHYAVPYLHPQAVSPHPLLFVLIYISLLQNGVKTCTTTSCIAMLLIITSHVIFLRRKQHPLTEIIKWISVYWHDKHVWRSCTALTHNTDCNKSADSNTEYFLCVYVLCNTLECICKKLNILNIITFCFSLFC